MTRPHTIIHPINLFELSNTLECLLTERCFVLKSMQHNSFEQVPQRNVVIFSKPFENLHHLFSILTPICTRSTVILSSFNVKPSPDLTTVSFFLVDTAAHHYIAMYLQSYLYINIT